MNRQNLFSGEWDGDDEDTATRRRVFWRPDDARMGATLYELGPGADEDALAHALRSRGDVLRPHRAPVVRKQTARRSSLRETSCSAPRGAPGLHAFSNPSEEPVRLLALSAGGFPDVVAYPEHGYAWVATRDPDPELLAQGGDPGSSPASRSRSSSACASRCQEPAQLIVPS